MDNRPSILIVDDEKGLRLGTKRLLEREGYDVTSAENGKQGISFGTSKEFDLAIIDLKMPDVDGITILKEIKSRYPNTVCFIATAYASYDTAIESAKLGAFSYIPKPFTPEELLNHISSGYKSRLLTIEKQNWLKEREERLLEIAFEKTRINTVINSIADGILVVNKSCEAVLYNPSALIFLGLDEIKIEEKILDKLHPEIQFLIKKFIDEGKAVKKSYSCQFEPYKDLFIEATSSPVPHPDGSLAGVVVVLRNITEHKKIENIKSQFVSMVSHELKAPIAAVYGFLKILSDPSIKTTEEQKKSFIERSQYRLDSLLKMVNDLLDISRIEMNTIRREIEDVDVIKVINSILDLFQLEIKNKKLNVNVDTCSVIPTVRSDYNELTRLFTNLISNGIKYNHENGSLNINICKAGSYLTVEISDTGIGMKPEEVKNLCQEFFRAKNEFTKNINGTGLGLTIVKKIVDSYSGKLEVKSEFKKGSSFKVFLPFDNKTAPDRRI